MAMRDKRKNAEYFEKYLEYQYKRIQLKEAKLRDSENDPAKKQRIYLSLIYYKMDLIFAEFSYGADKDCLKQLVSDALKTACEMDKLDHETLMNLMSLAVFLDCSEFMNELMILLTKFSKDIKKDKLLNLIACFIKGDELQWTGSLISQEAYGVLNNLLGNDAEKVLQAYLAVWYENRQDMSWYDAHKRTNDTYVGYWSFEAAALARIFQADESRLAEDEFYPVL